MLGKSIKKKPSSFSLSLTHTHKNHNITPLGLNDAGIIGLLTTKVITLSLYACLTVKHIISTHKHTEWDQGDTNQSSGTRMGGEEVKDTR